MAPRTGSIDHENVPMVTEKHSEGVHEISMQIACLWNYHEDCGRALKRETQEGPRMCSLPAPLRECQHFTGVRWFHLRSRLVRWQTRVMSIDPSPTRLSLAHLWTFSRVQHSA